MLECGLQKDKKGGKEEGRDGRMGEKRRGGRGRIGMGGKIILGLSVDPVNSSFSRTYIYPTELVVRNDFRK